MYDISPLYNATNFSQIVIFANDITDGFVMGLFLCAIFLVLLMKMPDNYDFTDRFMVASWVCFVISVAMVWGKFLSPLVMFGFLICAGAASFYKSVS